MTEQEIRSLNHFAGFRFTTNYFQLEADERKAANDHIKKSLKSLADSWSVYSLFPTTNEADFLLWTAVPLEDDDSSGDFFENYLVHSDALRRFAEPAFNLWGYTAPSTYSRAKSAQEMDPFDQDRLRYLVLYPFVKTSDWYLLSRDARQGMMNEHIRLGKQYPQIKQLLLYSFGLQDQEFVVVFETTHLPLFSKLVQELRATDARPYTQRDTPLYTAVLQSQDDPLARWSPQ
jgi:chlorite dismutase